MTDEIPPEGEKLLCNHTEIFWSRWYLWDEPNQWVVSFPQDATHEMRFCKVCRKRQLRGSVWTKC